MFYFGQLVVDWTGTTKYHIVYKRLDKPHPITDNTVCHKFSWKEKTNKLEFRLEL